MSLSAGLVALGRTANSENVKLQLRCADMDGGSSVVACQAKVVTELSEPEAALRGKHESLLQRALNISLALWVVALVEAILGNIHEGCAIGILLLELLPYVLQ